jgi:hypothetical protein
MSLRLLILGFFGCFFTWNNHSEGPRFVARKLDRVLGNEECFCNFGSSNVEFLSSGVSDHSPALISIGSIVSFGPKPFKFYNYWIEHQDFMSWVSSCWNKEFHGVPMFRLYSKLKALKAVMKVENAACFGNLRSRVVEARGKLDLAQKAVLDTRGSAGSLLRERECLHAYVSITKAEEAFLRQKTRVQWLQLGDQNTAFFHRMLKGRQARNYISFLYDEQGNKVADVDHLKGLAEDFYRKLLGS